MKNPRLTLLPRQLIAVFGAKNESVCYSDFAIKALISA